MHCKSHRHTNQIDHLWTHFQFVCPLNPLWTCNMNPNATGICNAEWPAKTQRQQMELSGLWQTNHSGGWGLGGRSHTNLKHCNPFFWTKNIWDQKSTNLILNPTICWKTVRLARKSGGKKWLTALLRRRRRWDCCVRFCVCVGVCALSLSLMPNVLHCPGSCKRLV